MTDTILWLLAIAVAALFAYQEGHYAGRKMVREEWIKSLHERAKDQG